MENREVAVKELRESEKNLMDLADPGSVDCLALDMEDMGYDDDFPIIVCDSKVIDGRHRVLAARKAGLTRIPAIVLDEDELERFESTYSAFVPMARAIGAAAGYSCADLW